MIEAIEKRIRKFKTEVVLSNGGINSLTIRCVSDILLSFLFSKPFGAKAESADLD